MVSSPSRPVSQVQLSQLSLDRENPRLLGQAEKDSEEAIIARLYRTAELDELLESISTNGYLDIEPLVVTDADDGTLIVLEGNRRLATLRLLSDPTLADRIRRQEHVEIQVPPADAVVSATFRFLSVYKVASRSEARTFIGFKHINGPAKWNAYAKAKFASDWHKSGIGLRQIARAIGDRHDTIKRMVFAIYVLEQIEFEIKDVAAPKFNFSHLYTALARSQYMSFLDIKTSWAKYDPEPNPVPADHLAQLRDVLTWIYGSRRDGVQPVIRVQNPDIKRLGEVLASGEAVHILRIQADLDLAHAATESVDTRFTASLFRARHHIRDAASTLRAYDGRDESLVNVAEDIIETANSVHLSMLRKCRKSALT